MYVKRLYPIGYAEAYHFLLPGTFQVKLVTVRNGHCDQRSS